MSTEDIEEPKEPIHSFEEAITFYAEIKLGWTTKKSYVWSLAANSLRAALQHLDAPETAAFLEEFLSSIIEVLTFQNPKIVGANERKCVDLSMTYALGIIVNQMPGLKYLDVLIRILDPATIHYAGKRVSMVHVPGFPASRLEMLNVFARLDGYTKLLNAIRQPDCGWLGTRKIYVIVKALSESFAVVDEGIRIEFAEEIMTRLRSMSDEQSKKESTDHLGQLIRAIGLVCLAGAEGEVYQYRQRLFYNFWMDFTLKGVQSASIVLRLAGWDQVGELIKEALSSKYPAAQCQVEGAGSPEVNGLYVFTSYNTDGTTCYTKTSDDPEELPITLNRCLMKNKSHYWFLTQSPPLLDDRKVKDDVDFYQHKTHPFEDREPPTHGWSCLAQGAGEEPPPTIVKIGKLIPAGMSEEACLINTLPHWCAQNDLIGLVFTASPHREIISRSTKLISLLASTNSLTPAHLQTIWKTAITTHDVDITDEIFSLLAISSVYMTDTTFATLIDLASNSLSTEEAILSKIAQFVEKFSHDQPIDIIPRLSDFAAVRLLSLIWVVYKNPAFETLKIATALQEFLSRCLGLPSCRQAAVVSINECLNSLSSQYEASKSAVGGPPVETSEAALSRVMQTLRFLISKNFNGPPALELDSLGFSAHLVREIQRFVRVNRPRYLSGAVDKAWYYNEVLNRLLTLRQFYGLNVSLRISVDTLNELWSLLNSQAVEIDPFS